MTPSERSARMQLVALELERAALGLSRASAQLLILAEEDRPAAGLTVPEQGTVRSFTNRRKR